jgi:ADP-ribose pyrophosphatase
MPRVVSIEIVEDRTSVSRCDEGFLRLKRYVARNRRADGSTSPAYPIDVIDRPTLDAVAVCLYARTAEKVEVLTRLGLRPAVHFRSVEVAALPEPRYLLFEEIVAGVLEPGERGIESLRRRAAEEVLEEAGFRIAPACLEALGAPFFMLPGIVSEKIHLLVAEIPRSAIGEVASGDLAEAPQEGDGSPLEEGALLRWIDLNQAIAACEQGTICDAKTEIALRRLWAKLSSDGKS